MFFITDFRLQKLHPIRDSTMASDDQKDDKALNEDKLKQQSDLKHILGSYFLEVEGACKRAENEIDSKFDEIARKLSAKRNELKQQINEWKVERLEVASRANKECKAFDKASEFVKYVEFNCNRF